MIRNFVVIAFVLALAATWHELAPHVVNLLGG